MKYFCIWTVVAFGFLKVLVCKVSCGNGWLAKSCDSCSLTAVGRGIFFFPVKTVVKWNIWKICSMQNGSSHTFILTFRFDLRERRREDSEIAIHRWLVRVLLFYTLLCVFGLGWIFLHVFADLSIPSSPRSHVEFFMTWTFFLFPKNWC